jgi:hypothetical protein
MSYQQFQDAYPRIKTHHQEEWLKNSVIPYHQFYYGSDEDYKHILRNTPNFSIDNEIIDGNIRCSGHGSCPKGSHCVSGVCQPETCVINSDCSSNKCLNDRNDGYLYRCRVDPVRRVQRNMPQFDKIWKEYAKVNPLFVKKDH